MEEDKKLCCYGCGQEARFKFKNGKECCSNKVSDCPEIRRKRKDRTLYLWKSLKDEGIFRLKDVDNKRSRTSIKPDFCEYGCGLEAKHQLKNGKWCCEDSSNKCPENRRKNSEIRKQQCRDGITSCNFVGKNLGRAPWCKGLTKETDARIKKRSEKLKSDYKNGIKTFIGHPHSKETRDKLSRIRTENLKKLGGGGFLSIKWYHVKNIKEEDFIVRGTWEVFVSECLNQKKVLWIKPKPILYQDQNGYKHRYSPDFYLPELNKYIEVKGYFSEKDREKLNCVCKQNFLEIIFVDQFWFKKLKAEEIDLFKIPNYKVLNEKETLDNIG